MELEIPVPAESQHSKVMVDFPGIEWNDMETPFRRVLETISCSEDAHGVWYDWILTQSTVIIDNSTLPCFPDIEYDTIHDIV